MHSLLLALLSSQMAGAAPGGPVFDFVPITANGQPQAMTLDASGNIYIASTIRQGAACAWDTHAEHYPSSPIPCAHAVITKLESAGKVVYSLTVGGSSEDQVMGIAVDGSGIAWITGYTYSADFPVTYSAAQSTFAGPKLDPPRDRYPPPGGDVFIAAVNADGSGLAYATYWGGKGNDYPSATALDRAGNLYIAGVSDSEDFPTTGAAYRRSGGLSFLIKLRAGLGASAVYSTRFDQAIQAIASDDSGNAYALGSASASAPVPVTAGAFQRTAQGNEDVFVTKFDAQGSSLLYSTYLGGSGSDVGTSVAVDPDGNAYISGMTSSDDFPITSGTAAAGNVFLTKLNPAGSRLVFSIKLDWPGSYSSGRLFLDSSDNAYYFGRTTSIDGLPVTVSGLRRGGCGSDPYWPWPFLARFAPSGDLDFLSYLPPWQAGSGPSTFDPVRGRLLALTHSGPGIGSVELTATAPVPPSALYCALNAARQAGSNLVAPGEVVTLWGDNFGPNIPVVGVPGPDARMPQTLGGVRVLIDGIALPLLYVSGNQINAVTPFALTPRKTVQAHVEYSGGKSNPLLLGTEEIDFCVFRSTYNGWLPAVINQDGTLNSAANPAAPGSAVAVWATGLGRTDPPSLDGAIASYPLPRLTATVAVDCMIAGEGTAAVEYAGAAPTLVAGVSQINFRLPRNPPTGGFWCFINAWAGLTWFNEDQLAIWTK